MRNVKIEHSKEKFYWIIRRLIFIALYLVLTYYENLAKLLYLSVPQFSVLYNELIPDSPN